MHVLFYMDKFIYTPGPTNIRKNVRLRLSEITTNPDVDEKFVNQYRETCLKLGKLMKTKNDVYILGGEGILGLEAACISLTEKGDRVLVIDNGIYGRGFGDFVKLFGGEVVWFKGDYKKEIDINELKNFLKEDNNFKYATIVHCDTPTGVLNDLSHIIPLLKSYEILTVVDTVSATIGEPLEIDEWGIDIAIGGSQKALSAPSGLTIVSVSEEIKEVIKNRKTSINGFYNNLTIWENYYKNKWFPYTMPINNINALERAVDNIIDEGLDAVINRHKKIAKVTRSSLRDYGLKLFLENGFSNTVTAIEIPQNIGAINLKKHIEEKYNALFSTSLDEFNNSILRIGHIGENAFENEIKKALRILDMALRDLGYETEKNLVSLFDYYKKEKKGKE